jgi:hypothetical protein
MFILKLNYDTLLHENFELKKPN